MNYTFIIIISIFLTLYGGLHYYFYRKITGVFRPSGRKRLYTALILLVFMLSPIIMRFMDNKSPESVYTAVTYTGYFWMGIIFLLFSFNLPVDIYRFIIFVLSGTVKQSLIKLYPNRKITFYVIASLTAFIIVYGIMEAGMIRTERIVLRTDKLPPEIDSLKIVQVTDIHFSRMNGLNFAKKITDIISGLSPDVLVSTGDMLDQGLAREKEVTALFKNISVKYGKYATTGNHEFITGIEKTGKFTEESGFRLLRNEWINVTGFLSIAAIDDPAADRGSYFKGKDESEVLRDIPPERIILFLKHQPGVQEKSIGKFDLQLSGHTHDGQIFPFKYLVGLSYKYMSGLYDLGSNSYLYVSRGTGTWGPPVRFLSPPEITVIEFVKKENSIKTGL